MNDARQMNQAALNQHVQLKSCAGCAKARQQQQEAERERDHVLRMGGWRIVLASLLDEARTRLMRGRVGDY